ncbi:MAG: hypothetical protein RIQ83_485 [Pseudomonadota bacterium]|jgi:hypothetical protein
MRYFCDRLTTWLDGFVEGMGGGYVECGHLSGPAPLLVAFPTLNDTDLLPRIPWPSAHFTRFERAPHGDLLPLAEQSGWPCWQLQRAFLHETGLTMTLDDKTLN